MMAEEPQSAMNQVVWHNGKVMYGSPIPTVDSITFAAEIESSDTLHLILPRTIIKEVHDTTIKEVIKEVIVEVHDTIIKKVYQCPQEPLPGVFSVAADKQVKFSKGNLQYTQSTATWTFAENQYDMLGTANVVDGALADTIDLFGWSGSTGAAKWGIATSTSNSDHSGDFVDWGQNIDDVATWRTLTNNEWGYMLSTRANAANLMGVARINFDAEGTTYANGLILLPDTWTCPEDITFKSGFISGEYSVEDYANYQTLALTEWQKLEAAGAVFLPATGRREGTSFNHVQYLGCYWSATPLGKVIAFFLSVAPYGASTENTNRLAGQAVRLVQDL